MLKNIVISSLIVNFILLLGRFTGLAREVLLVNIYGVSPEADVVSLLITFPDFLVALLAGGALSAALVPAFSKLDKDESELLATQVSIVLFFIFGLIAIILYFFVGDLVSILAPGFSESRISSTSKTVVWTFIILPISVVSGVCIAYLHSFNKFLIASLSTPILNVIVLIGLSGLWFAKSTLFSPVVASLIIAACVRLFILLFAVKFSFVKEVFSCWVISLELIKKYLQAFMSGALILLFPIIARAFSSLGGDGGVAIFNYARKLIELPVIISVSLISIVLLPRLASSFKVDVLLHSKLIKYGLQFVISISTVSGVVLIILARDYVSLIYQSGLTDEAILKLSNIVKIGLLGLPIQSLNVFFTSVSNSRGNTKLPMYINLFGIAFLFVILKFFIVEPSVESVMWVVVVAYALCCTLHFIFFKVDNFNFLIILNNKLFSLMFIVLLCLVILIAPLIFNYSNNLWGNMVLGFVLCNLWVAGLVISHSDARLVILRKLKRA